MATKLEGATRTDAHRFDGEEISKLAESPQLVRWGGLDEEHVAFLAADIAAHGQQTPVLLRKRADGKPEMIAGRHRRAAILKINEDPSAYGLPSGVALMGVYKDLSEQDAIRASFMENTGKPLTCMDLAHAASQFANLGWETKQISETLTTPHHKVGAVRVAQLKALIRLPHSVQLALHKGELPESAARAMIRLGVDGEEMEKLAGQLEKGDLSVADLTSKANAQRRAKGAKVKRSLNDLRKKLDDLGTVPASTLLSWIDGEVSITDEMVEEIFAESEA